MVFFASSASNAPQSPPNDHVPNAIAETSRSVLPSRTFRMATSRSDPIVAAARDIVCSPAKRIYMPLAHPLSPFVDPLTFPARRVFTQPARLALRLETDRKSTRLNSSHSQISYAVFCL